MKVMSAIERCRAAALGGHVARCENAACGHTVIAYNSCRNRHCQKCQGAASRRWLSDREAELLPVPYFHVVYTLPSELRDIAYQNKRVVYDLLMKAAAETTLAIAIDPKRLGARIGVTAVLHTWGSAMTHHPHVHMIVPGGGLSLDSARWVAARSNFLMHVNVLARLFRGKMLAMLMEAHAAGQLKFFNTHAGLAEKSTFKRFIAPLRRIKWVVYCKAPFAGPEQVLRGSDRFGMLLRALIAWGQGDRHVWSVVRVPSVDEEDLRRSHRERDRLVRERTAHINRIKGLLFGQGTRPCRSTSWSLEMGVHCRHGLPARSLGRSRGWRLSRSRLQPSNASATKLRRPARPPRGREFS